MRTREDMRDPDEDECESERDIIGDQAQGGKKSLEEGTTVLPKEGERQREQIMDEQNMLC